jgi:hypothetical protein
MRTMRCNDVAMGVFIGVGVMFLMPRLGAPQSEIDPDIDTGKAFSIE